MGYAGAMTVADFVLLGLFFAALLGSTPFLGAWLARVLDGNPPRPLSWMKPLEGAVYRLGGIRPADEMSWRAYAGALLVFGLVGGLVVLGLQLAQAHLPLNPENFGAVPLGGLPRVLTRPIFARAGKKLRQQES